MGQLGQWGAVVVAVAAVTVAYGGSRMAGVGSGRLSLADSRLSRGCERGFQGHRGVGRRVRKA